MEGYRPPPVKGKIEMKLKLVDSLTDFGKGFMQMNNEQ
jgi:hypothetical protein